MIKKCKICGKEFEVESSHSNNRKYCDECRHKKCPICGETFLIKPGIKRVPIYCGRSCAAAARKGIAPPDWVTRMARRAWNGSKSGDYITCENCGKEHYCYPRDIKTNRRFCSNKCYREFISKNASPKRNNKDEEKQWRREVHRLHDYTCWICGERGGRLEAHHILSWAKYPDHRFDINNGMTLCKFCHKTYTDYGKH